MPWVVKAWKPDAFAARLDALEQLGTELRAEVLDRRKPRRGRATMHDSPLGELFRATRAGEGRRPALGHLTSAGDRGPAGSRFAHSGAHAAGARRPDRAPATPT